MSHILDDFLNIKHRIKKRVDPIQEDINDLLSEIDPSLSSHSDISVIKQPARLNKARCANLLCSEDTCGLCEKLCPREAIVLTDKDSKIKDSCDGCGICSAICPNQAISSSAHVANDIFNQVGRNSALYNTSYITCENTGLVRNYPNVYILPCLAAMSRAQWTFIMNVYSNVSLYIPEDACQKCELKNCESLYRTQISMAEKAGMYPLHLTRHEEEIDTRMKPHIEREDLAVSLSKNHLKSNLRLEALGEIEMQKHMFREIESKIFEELGKGNAQGVVRRLTDDKKFDVLSVLYNEKAKEFIPHKYPVVDPYLCTGCGKCSEVCSVGACEVDCRGTFHLSELLCVGCGACSGVCDESALTIISR